MWYYKNTHWSIENSIYTLIAYFTLDYPVPECKTFLSFFLYFIYLFLAAYGLSLVAASGGHSLLWCTGFSPQWPLLLRSTGSQRAGSVVVAHGLSSCGTRDPERRLSSCGALAQLLPGMWDLPGPGPEPMSPALAGGFLTTVPPGKPKTFLDITQHPCPYHTIWSLIAD